jgi:hypothetical protein
MDTMRCAGCGQALTEGVSVCLRCGTPVPPGYSAKRAQVAMLPDPVPPSGDNWTSFSAPPTSPYQKSDELGAPVAPPPPPIYAPGVPNYASGMTDNLFYQPTTPMAHGALHWRRLVAIVVVCAVALLSLGIYAYVHAMGRNGSTVSGGLNSMCAVPTIDRSAASNLEYPQLTNGLRDPAHNDFAPIDTANTFHTGQTIYLTFTVASNANAKLTAEWCLGQSNNTYEFTLDVNRKYGTQGYFKLETHKPDKVDVGNGVLVVWWNNAVAYTTEFVVKP